MIIWQYRTYMERQAEHLSIYQVLGILAPMMVDQSTKLRQPLYLPLPMKTHQPRMATPPFSRQSDRLVNIPIPSTAPHERGQMPRGIAETEIVATISDIHLQVVR